MIKSSSGRARPRRLKTLLAGLTVVALATAAAGVALATAAPAAAASAAKRNPIGHLDLLKQQGDGFEVRGWAIDPDTAASIKVNVRVDGATVSRKVANVSRPDVARVHRAYGAKHGFDITVPWKSGKHTVCVYALNVGRGTANPKLGCASVTISYNPTGTVDTVKQIAGGMQVAGWAFDPSRPKTPLTVSVTVSGPNLATSTTKGVTSAITKNVVGGIRTTKSSIKASLSRSGLARAHPAAGANHGFSLQLAAGNGTYTVCVTAMNVGKGANTTLPCKTATLDFSPVGAITALTQSPNGYSVTGWATDPDTTAALTVAVRLDGNTVQTLTANRAGGAKPGHMLSYTGTATAGTHSVCLYATNVGNGQDRNVACQNISLNFNPTTTITSLSQATVSGRAGVKVAGWAQDPDSTAPVTVSLSLDGAGAGSVTANGTGGAHSGHNFSAFLPTSANGQHTVSAVATNLGSSGPGAPTPATSTVTLDFDPIGALESLSRAADGTSLVVKGWALDPTAPSTPINVVVSIDGVAQPAHVANVSRPDLASSHPGLGTQHGFDLTFADPNPSVAGEHRVCATAVPTATGTGNQVQVGCQVIIAVHPAPPSAPQSVVAQGGYGGAVVSWTAPASDGGAPVTSYTVTSSPDKNNPKGISVPVAAGSGTLSATIAGLLPKTTYTFTVTASNICAAPPSTVGCTATGPSAVATATATTQDAPPPQTSPAPVSTSRYTRNLHGTSADIGVMQAEGAADAAANPSGHGYLILLDIGGQDHADGGVVLSAGVRFVSYSALVNDIKAYVAGYHSKQKPSAPITIALGTNNDMDVSATTGTEWATKIVNPVATYAKQFPGITIAGANDIEPGFRANYASSAAWVNAFLNASKTPFVFNGSADGCSPSTTGRTCNNKWTMGDLYNLAAGASPSRILNLPQVYNTTMAAQWKFISLTGIAAKRPKINFGGPLTEWTACSQAGSCGSLTGHNAWSTMWADLQSDSRLKVASLPYSTDLRIDR